MDYLLIILLVFAGLFVTATRSPSAAFGWVYLPVLLLLPQDIWIGVPGLPDLNPRRAVLLSILIGAFARGKSELAAGGISWVDRLLAVSVVAWSISYATNTNLMGFIHQLTSVFMDWCVPYLLVRRLWFNNEVLRHGLLPLSICAVTLSCLAVYEARMGTRAYAEFWDGLVGSGVVAYFEQYRWGYLRAAVAFDHPITLGVVCATLSPLVLILAKVQSRWVKRLKLAVVVCAIGTIASISRGPMLAVLVAFSTYWLLSKQRKLIYLSICLAGLWLVPVVLEWLAGAVQYVESSLGQTGNVESGYYRLALFLIYLDDIRAGGLFGNPEAIGQDFEQAFSIDNAYIFMFLTYGVLGGALFLVLVLVSILLPLLVARRSTGDRRFHAALLCGAASALAFSMVNVWFSHDYAPLFFIVLAMAVNLAIRGSIVDEEMTDRRIGRREGRPSGKNASGTRW